MIVLLYYNIILKLCYLKVDIVDLSKILNDL